MEQPYLAPGEAFDDFALGRSLLRANFDGRSVEMSCKVTMSEQTNVDLYKCESIVEMMGVWCRRML